MTTARHRVGILGGTFDPVHLGHLDAADAARRALDLDAVLLLPSYRPPHRIQPHVSSYQRFAMVGIASLERERLVTDDQELVAAVTSYTSDTLQRLHGKGYRADRLFFITGADAFAEIATWRDYPRLLELAHFAVVSRGQCRASALRQTLPRLAPLMRIVSINQAGSAALPSATADPAVSNGALPIFLIDAPTAPTSSTEIRNLLARGQSVAHLLPKGVAAYIRRHGLYEADSLHGQD
jgi:nicotinate-nucleotide adenylyltransferase